MEGQQFLTGSSFLNSSLNMSRDKDSITWTAGETRPVEIRGELRELMEFRGSSKDGVEFRAWTVLFPGKGGPALAAIVSPEASWDGEAAREFLDSLR